MPGLPTQYTFELGSSGDYEDNTSFFAPSSQGVFLSFPDPNKLDVMAITMIPMVI